MRDDVPKDGGVQLREWNLFLLSQLGRLRLVNGDHRAVQLTGRQPQRVARAHARAAGVFVQVRRRLDVDPPDQLLVSPSRGMDPSSSISVDLATGPFEQILVDGEGLYLRSDIDTRVVVTTVILSERITG